jgi:putative nucleotidyltransferase with HDIG domain
MLAEQIADVLGIDRATLVAAAYLHDIGYAPSLAIEGFHPLDGARFVRAYGHEDLARLVAHHTGARYEAALRGTEGFVEEFPFEDSLQQMALTYCDVHTSPDGHRVSLEDRVAEINHRYGPEHVVARAINAALPEFERARDEIESRIADSGLAIH